MRLFIATIPFYLKYLTRTGIFGLLASLETEYAEAALALAIQKLSDVLVTSDNFWLLEVDFFTLQLGQANSWQEEVRELAAVNQDTGGPPDWEEMRQRSNGPKCLCAPLLNPFRTSRVIRRLKFYRIEPLPVGI